MDFNKEEVTNSELQPKVSDEKDIETGQESRVQEEDKETVKKDEEVQDVEADKKEEVSIVPGDNSPKNISKEIKERELVVEEKEQTEAEKAEKKEVTGENSKKESFEKENTSSEKRKESNKMNLSSKIDIDADSPEIEKQRKENALREVKEVETSDESCFTCILF